MLLRPNIFAASVDLANLVDIEDVEICQTGIEYNLASGPRTFTVDDLKDAVESQDDPAVKRPRLKMGHVADIGLMDDGQPAIGTVAEMRLEQDGHTILGTYKGIPEWLANILPSAYPARSIEGAVGVETNTGHNWRLVITDLALLGVVWPGVSTLDDIQVLYSKDGPDNIQVLTTKEEVAALSVAAAALVTAQVDVDNIMRAYREQKSPDQFWWWVRSMMIDPNELIVEDEDNGELYRVPYATKGDAVTFEDPIAVKIVYKDKPRKKEDKETANLAVAATVAAWSSFNPSGKMIAQYESREESMSGTVATELDPVALRNALGLDDDATDEQVQTALAAAGLITAPASGGSDGSAPASEQTGTQDGQRDNAAPGNAGNDPGTGQPNVQPAPTPADAPAGTITPPTAAATASSDTVTLDRATYDELRAGAAAGHRAETRQLNEERDRVINDAIQAGKIMPSRLEHWQRKWTADEQEARTLLTASEDKGGLAPGVLPVAQVGGESPLEDTTVEAYPSSWLPELQRKGGDGQ